ncbi:MAG TPA: LpxL/LpxP family Kdo(2)-lipid IV(A) lauroyl/palmitoleoyl acyltransferase [Gammaproteobacteria bacterium]
MAAFLKPRYWTTWLLLAAMRLCARLPYPRLVGLGKTLGDFLYRVLPERRRIAAVNLELCFPEKSGAERQELLRRSFHSMGIAVMETALAWWGSENKLKTLYTVEGLKYLEQATAAGKPILLLSGHISCTEIGSRLLAFHLPFQAMYKPAKNALYEHVMLRQRSRFYYAMVPRKDSRRLLRNLKQNITTWYAPDQNFGREDTVFAPFFGIPATTLTATARIAKFAGAAVIPFFSYRLDHNKGYKLVLGKPLENFPIGDEIADATRINQIIEAAARLAPEQYLWAHKRFRIRPPGEQKLY